MLYCSYYKQIVNWHKYSEPRSNDEFVKVLRLIDRILNEKMVLVHLLDKGDEKYTNCYKLSDALNFRWLTLIENKFLLLVIWVLL